MWAASGCGAPNGRCVLHLNCGSTPLTINPPTPPRPQKTEFQRIAYATSVGFLIMGFIGFFVKLVHIPINNILLGGF